MTEDIAANQYLNTFMQAVLNALSDNIEEIFKPSLRHSLGGSKNCLLIL